MNRKYRSKEDIEQLRKLSRVLIAASLIVICLAGALLFILASGAAATSLVSSL